MSKMFDIGILAAMSAMSSGNAAAVSPNADELAKSRQWAAAKFETGVEPFFSFVYDGKPSAELLKTWETKRASRILDERRTQHTVAYTDPKTGLVLRCVAIEYRDYPAVEWTLYFKNTGKQDSPILGDIQALDVAVRRGQQGEFLLHHEAGSQANSDDYRPLEMDLRPEATARFAPMGGWASSNAWPYYNLQWAGEGLIIAVGWPGQWAAKFSRDRTGWPPRHRRPGDDAIQAIAGRGGPQPADSLAVLEGWRLDPRPEHLASLADRPQHAASGRKTAAAVACRRFFRAVQRNDRARTKTIRSCSSTVTSIMASRSTSGGWMPAGTRTRPVGRTWARGRSTASGFPMACGPLPTMPTPGASMPCCGSSPSESRRGHGFTRTGNRGCWAATASRSSSTTAFPRRSTGWPATF